MTTPEPSAQLGSEGPVAGQPLRAPLRYMGTKRILAPLVRREIDAVAPPGRVADLFAGLGSVAQAMASKYPVLVNDGLTFTGPLARARFTEPEQPRPRISDLLSALYPHYHRRRQALTKRFSDRLQRESSALVDGPATLRPYLEAVGHVGNSVRLHEGACRASGRKDSGKYVLTTLYFSGGYFSTSQAIELDALRCAIDRYGSCSDWLLAAWLAAAAAVINAPGHSAQYLKPSTTSAYHRIRRQWSRPIWPVFISKLEEIVPVGNRTWRAANLVCHEDALSVLQSDQFHGIGMVYADPPYTKDQYSRFYHVYETLFCYDFPESVGLGRYRGNRFKSMFSMESEAEREFIKLFERVASRGIPLVLSYPTRSILSRKGVEIRDLLSSYFTIKRETVVDYRHSTMGASNGNSHLSAREQLFVCLPRTK